MQYPAVQVAHTARVKVRQGLEELAKQVCNISICHFTLADQMLQQTPPLDTGAEGNQLERETCADSLFKYQSSFAAVDDTTNAVGNVWVVEVEHCAELVLKCLLTDFLSHYLHSMSGISCLVLGLVHLAEPPSAEEGSSECPSWS